ncbi:MAG: PaaI family thioesterase [Burkholderiales bacterium]
MTTLGAELVHIAAGEVDIALPFNDRLTQQDGFLHAGVVAGVTDSACGYAALTTMAAEAEVLTVEFKINLLAPAAGERLVVRGRVIRSGRTLTVCRGDAFTISDGREKHVATLTTTMIAVTPNPS